MPARQANIPVPKRAWTELTASDVTKVFAQNIGKYAVVLKATTGPAPSDAEGGMVCEKGEGITSDVLVSDWFQGAGITSVARLWAWCNEAGTVVSVNHA